MEALDDEFNDGCIFIKSQVADLLFSMPPSCSPASRATAGMQRCAVLLSSTASSHAPLLISCRWRLNEPLEAANGIRTLDLFLAPDEMPGANHVLEPSHTPASAFLASATQDLFGEANRQVAIKLVLPVAGGYVIRADLLEFRLHGCLLVHRSASFVEPRQHVQGFRADFQPNDAEQLRLALESALGAVSTKPSEPEGASRWVDVVQTADRLEDELRDRLSLDWFSVEPVAPKRIAFVKPPQDHLSYTALKAMGIGLVVLDDPGSWLQDDQGPHAHLRDLFVPFDTNPDREFKERLKEVASRARVDGILTRSEEHCAKVAQACHELGLPTAPPEAFRKGTDKYAQRQLDNEDGAAFCVSGVEELQRRLDSSVPLPDFPLVVKPTTGTRSQCVSKVSNVDDLVHAVAKIKERVLGHQGSSPIVTDALIEPYISGPEIDANLVMWDGELLFCEIADDFPSSADRQDSTMDDDFQESMFVFPSKLPPRELGALQTSLHRILLRLGFTSGVFHLEARVRNSSMHYVQRQGSTVDLVELSPPPSQHPSVFLVEVNPRPPAYLGLMTAAYTYGIDYFILFALNALGDAARFKALSRPFLRGPQYASALVIVNPERGGRLISDYPAELLQRNRPDLLEHIPIYREVFSKGDEIPDPNGPWMSYMSCIMVISRTGREQLLRTIEEVRSEWKHEIG